MRKFYFGKVIRDKILLSMQQEGCEIEYRKLVGADRQTKLIEKLLEEAAEVADSVESDEFLEELADVQLVMEAVIGGLGVKDRQKLDKIHQDKLDRKGGFGEGIWVESVSIPDDSAWIKYFESKPDKYPEL